MRMLRVGVLCLLLSGCTTATVELPGKATVHFTRFWTDAYISVGQDGVVYSSSPSEQALAQSQARLEKLVGVLLRAVAIQEPGL